jgi:hypothetical protein
MGGGQSGLGVLEETHPGTALWHGYQVGGELLWSGQRCSVSTPFGGRASGTVKEIWAPRPGVLSAQIVPP